MTTFRRALPLPPADDRHGADGLLMPWLTPERVSDDGETWYMEQFAPSSVLIAPGQSIPVYDDHDAVTGEHGPHIGDVTDLAHTDAGLMGRMVWLDGVTPPAHDGLSIEFDAFDTEDRNGIATRVRSQITHLAVVPQAAYRQARILARRSTPTDPNPEGPTHMDHDETTPPTADNATPAPPAPAPAPAVTPAVTADPDEARRRAAATTLGGGAPVVTHAARFESFGEYVQAAARGQLNDADRRRFARALASTGTAANPGSMPEQWVTDIVDLIGTAQPFVTAFSSLPLPDKGDTISYPKITTRPLIGKQDPEGEEIATRAMLVTKGAADVETYAGGQNITLQEVLRSDPSYLQLAYEVYAEEMAAFTDVSAIAAVAAAVPAPNKLTIPSGEFTLLNAQIVDGVYTVLKSRCPNDLVFVLGLGIWKEFASAVDDQGRPLFPTVSPLNPVGRISLTNDRGEVRDLQFALDPNMAEDKGYLGYRRAYTSMLSPVSTLTADTVATLGRDYAVYRFGAHLVRKPTAIVEYTLAPAVP